MNKSVNHTIENKVIELLELDCNYKPKLKSVNNGILLGEIYEMEFPDKNTLTFKIEWNKENMSYYFQGTTILHLELLSEILGKLMKLLKNNEAEISGYFEIENNSNRSFK